MSTNQEAANKAAIRRMLDVLNSHDAKSISDVIDEFFLPELPSSTPLPMGTTGPEAFKRVFRTLHRAFPDLRVTVEELIAEGDKLVARNSVTGTHRGDFMGVAPTGRSVTYDEIFVFRFSEGRIAEVKGVVDMLSQLKQLGLVEDPRAIPAA